MFNVVLWDRTNSLYAAPPDLRLTPTRIAGTAQGGFDSAEITVDGPAMQLRDVRRWLRYRLQVVGVAGMVWDGYIDEVSLTMGGATVTVSTERMFNAVKVLYSYTGDDGGGESGETDWLTDDDSIAEYGRKEVLHSAGGEISTASAEAMRLTVLTAHAKASRPSVTVQPQQGVRVDSATLYCKGRWQALEWRYYTDLTGYEAHEDLGGQRAILGWKLTATTIGFVSNPNNRILDFGGKLGPIKENDQLLVSGSTSNNGVKVVKSEVAGDTATYSSTGINFDPTDDIKDTALGLGFIRAREGLRVQGSPNNDGYYFIGDVVGADRVEAVGSFGAMPIVSDSAGPNVTLTMAHNVETTTALSHETPGASITLTAYGQKVAQRFSLTTGPWDVGEIAVNIAKFGTPTDNVKLQIWNNASAAPNALLGTATLAGADIPNEQAAWRSVKLATPITLANATDYHVVVERTGTANADNWFEVTIDDDGTYPRGGVRLYDGSAWQIPAFSGDMPFKLFGVVTTTQKIADIVSAVTTPAVSAASIVTATTVYTRRKRDGRSTAWEEIKTLLDTGTASGARLTCYVTEGGTLVIDQEPTPDALDLIWRDSGQLIHADGKPVLPGVLPFGKWVQIESLVADDWQGDVSKMLVERAEYDCQGGTWTLQPKEAPDPYNIGSEQG
jgi:hypothetical protein